MNDNIALYNSNYFYFRQVGYRNVYIYICIYEDALRYIFGLNLTSRMEASFRNRARRPFTLSGDAESRLHMAS